MLGTGTVINPIVKIATTVAILAAISIFVVKPIIDTTEKASTAASVRSERATQEAQKRSEKLQLDISRSIALSAAQSARATGDGRRAKRIVTCIRRAEAPGDMDFCRAL